MEYRNSWWRFYLRPFLASAGRKRLDRVVRELIACHRHYGLPPRQYFHLALYERQAGTDVTAFVPRRILYDWQANLNRLPELALVRDKRAFRARMQAYGLPCIAELFTVTADGTCTGPDDGPIGADEAFRLIRAAGGRVFVKPVGNFGGSGGHVFDLARHDLPELLQRGEPRIVQPLLRQHPILDALYPRSVNTVRIDTLIDGDTVRSSAATLRLGMGGSRVDNLSRGGLTVPIDLSTGRLAGPGRRMPCFATRYYQLHPDTGVRFESLTLPHWPQVRDLVERGARALAPLGTLGWDVALTAEGPVLVEANANWGEDLFQLNRGLRDTPAGRQALEWYRNGAQRRREVPVTAAADGSHPAP
jgi:hypothetical protein